MTHPVLYIPSKQNPECNHYPFRKVFEEKSKEENAQQQRSERELARMKDVIAEITAENLDLKKTLSD